MHSEQYPKRTLSFRWRAEPFRQKEKDSNHHGCTKVKKKSTLATCQSVVVATIAQPNATTTTMLNAIAATIATTTKKWSQRQDIDNQDVDKSRDTDVEINENRQQWSQPNESPSDYKCEESLAKDHEKTQMSILPSITSRTQFPRKQPSRPRRVFCP